MLRYGLRLRPELLPEKMAEKREGCRQNTGGQESTLLYWSCRPVIRIVGYC